MRVEQVKAICAKKDDQEAHKAHFLKQLADCTTEDEKAKLMKEHDAFNDALNSEIERMSYEGALALER